VHRAFGNFGPQDLLSLRLSPKYRSPRDAGTRVSLIQTQQTESLEWANMLPGVVFVGGMTSTPAGGGLRQFHPATTSGRSMLARKPELVAPGEMLVEPTSGANFIWTSSAVAAIYTAAAANNVIGARPEILKGEVTPSQAFLRILGVGSSLAPAGVSWDPYAANPMRTVESIIGRERQKWGVDLSPSDHAFLRRQLANRIDKLAGQLQALPPGVQKVRLPNPNGLGERQKQALLNN